MNGDVIEPRIYFYYFAKWLCYLSFGQGGSFLKWVAANEITGQSAENGTSILTLLPPSLRKQSRREDREGIRAGGWGDKLEGVVFWSWHGYCNHGLTEVVFAYTISSQQKSKHR